MSERLQVGGSHYASKTGYEHWDWAMDVRLGGFEQAATKYISRWDSKGGIEDLQKIVSYLEKMRLGFLEGRYDNRCLHVDTWPLARDKAENMFHTFIESAEINQVEADLCLLMAQWRDDQDLDHIITMLDCHIEAATAALERRGTLSPLQPLTAPQAAKTAPVGGAGGATGQAVASSASTEVADRSARLAGMVGSTRFGEDSQ